MTCIDCIGRDWICVCGVDGMVGVAGMEKRRRSGNVWAENDAGTERGPRHARVLHEAPSVKVEARGSS
jgi:hypothetical protein